MQALTERQQEYLVYIKCFIADQDQFPPLEFLAERFGVTRSGAREMVLTLETLGHIERNVTGIKFRLRRHA